MLAAEEVRLTALGVRFLNEPLTAFMPGRSLESVKGKRKAPAYKALVQQLIESSEVEAEEVLAARVQEPIQVKVEEAVRNEDADETSTGTPTVNEAITRT